MNHVKTKPKIVYLGYILFALGAVGLIVFALQSASRETNVCEYTQTGDVTFCRPR